MASDDRDEAYTSSTTVQRRYWRRTDARAAWWPWGLLPLLGLFLLFLWGALRTAPHIQRDVQARVTDALGAAGVLVKSVVADGQDVAVSVLRAPVDDAFVRAIAESAVCDTWAGALDCPLSVSLTIVDAPAPPVVEPQPEPEPETPTPIAARPHDFVFSTSNRAVRLVGEVGALGDRIEAVNSAKALFEQIDDQLRVSGSVATDQQELAIDRALLVLSRLDQGEASWRNGQLDVRGRVLREADVAPARDAFFSEDARPPLGDIDVEFVELAQVVSRCNEQLADTLDKSTIRFRTASAQIDAGNDDLLVALADLIDRCPGTLTIEGHTDSTGDEAMNVALSQARADAVRTELAALGVPADRLNTRGFGSAQPVADNGTPAGRAQNRRIVIAVDAP